MKIRCDECQSVFLIDDTLISDKGVKAQCPKCGFQKIVWKQNAQAPPAEPLSTYDPRFAPQSLSGDALEAFSGPAGDNELSLDDGGGLFLDTAGAMSVAFPGGFEEDLTTPGTTPVPGSGGGQISCFKCGKPMEESPDAVLPICQDCINQPGGGDSDFGRPPASNYSPPANDFGAPPIGGDFGSPMGYNPTGSSNAYNPGDPPPINYSSDQMPMMGSGSLSALPAAFADSPPASGVLGPTSMVYTPHNKPDVIDYTSESLELDSSPVSAIPDLSAADSPAPRPSEYKFRRASDKKEFGPASLQESRSLYAHGQISLEDEYLSTNGSWRPISEESELVTVFKRTPRISENKKASSLKGGTKSKSSRPGKAKGAFGALLGLLVLGGAGWFGYTYMGLGSLGTTNTKQNNKRSAQAQQLFESKLALWKKTYTKQKKGAKTSKKLTKQALQSFHHDDAPGYRRAIPLFKRALVASSENDEALAGLALAALWSSTTTQGIPRSLREYEIILQEEAQRRKTPALRGAYAAFLARQGQGNRSIRLATKAAKNAPRNSINQHIAGELQLTQQKDHKRALGFFQRANKITPNMLRARYYAAQAYIESARYYKASQSLTPLIKRRHPQGTTLFAKIQVALGNYREAAKHLRQMLQKHPRMAKEHLDLAMIYYQLLNNNGAAQRHLQRAKRHAKKNKLLQKQVILHMGYIALKQNRLGLVKKYRKQLKTLDRLYMPGFLLDAQLKLKRRKYAEAAKLLEQVIAQLPNVPTQALLGYTYAQQKQTKKAFTLFTQLTNEGNRYVWPQLMLAAHLMKNKKETQASFAIKNSLDIEPSVTKNYQKPSHFYLLPIAWRATMRTFQRVRFPDRSVPHAAAGMVAYHMGQSGTARHWLNSAFSRDPRALAANLYLAFAYLDQKRYDKASKHALLAYETYNQHPSAALALGWVAISQKKYDKAERYFEQVKSARPWFVEGHVGLALLAAHNGKRGKALGILKGLLTTHRHHHRLLLALYQLKW